MRRRRLEVAAGGRRLPAPIARPWIFYGALALAAVCAVYAAHQLRVQVDTVAMFRTDLPHLQRWYDFAEQYPLLAEPLVVVVDAPAGDARAAAAKLADAMGRETGLFEQVQAPGSQDFFRRSGLLYRSREEIAELGDRLIAAQPFLARLADEPHLEGLFGLLDDALEHPEHVPRSETRRLLASVEAEVAAARSPRPAETGLAEALLDEGSAFSDGASSERTAGSASRALVLALPSAGRDGINPALPAIERIEALARELGLTPEAGFRVRVTGDLALSADELELTSENAAVTAVVSFVLVTGILLAGLRNPRLVLVLCGTLVVGLAWTAAFAAGAVGRLNMISVAFAVMSIGLGIDFGIHLGLRFRELAERGWSRRDALRVAMQDKGGALVWCALTTAVGFYAFLPTDFRGIAEFGLISGTGILLSLVATLVVLPAGIAALRPRIALRRRRSRPRLEALQRWPVRHPQLVLGGAAALTLAAALALPGLRFSGNPLDLRVPDSDSASAFQDLLASESDTPWNLHVTGRTPEEARRLASELGELESVERATSLASLLPAHQDQKLAQLEDVRLLLGAIALQRPEEAPRPEDRLEALADFGDDLDFDAASTRDPLLASGCRLRAEVTGLLASLEGDPERDAVLARLETRLVGPLTRSLGELERALDPPPVTPASLPAEIRELWQAGDGSWRIELAPAGLLESDEQLAAFVDEVRAFAPDVTGSAVNVVEADRMVVESLRLAFALAAAAIALLLGLLWRGADVVQALLPIGAAALWLLGGLAWLDAPLNFANVIVLPLILGIGIDSGVHMVALHRRSRSSLLGSSTTHAILLSCATTVASFGSLAFSSHPGMASMGRLLVLGVLCTLLANLLVLPALLALWDRRRSEKDAPSEELRAREASAWVG